MSRGNQGARSGTADLFNVFIDLHVVHEAAKKPVTAEELVEVLSCRGYKVTGRSISALLRKFESRGWLRSRRAQNGIVRRFQATPSGRKALEQSKPLVSVLFTELS